MKEKIILVYKDIQGEIAEEIIWSEKLNNGYHRVENIPFFAPNLAYNDIVTVEEDNGLLYFNELIESSGHSTIQIIFFKENKVKIVLKKLESLGCSWEEMKNQPYFALDVNQDVDFFKVRKVLNIEFENGTLDFKESCLSDRHIS